MQLAGAEIDIVPAQGDKLAGAQPMAVGEQDRGGVPMTPTVAAGGGHELLDSRSVRYSRGRLDRRTSRRRVA
jgi:hypothetical protein